MSARKTLAKLISTTRHLTEEAFEDVVNEVGYRKALVILRARAVEGDVKALDLYLKRCDQWMAKKRTHPREPMRKISSTAFIQQPRRADPDESSPG